MRPIEEFSESNRVIVEVLRDSGDGAARDAVIETVYETIDDELAEEVLRLIRVEGDPELRGALAISLGPTLQECDEDLDPDGRLVDFGGEFGRSLDEGGLSEAGYRKLVAGLEAIYRDASVPSLVRRRVLEAAVRSPQPWHEGAVRAAWLSDDDEWRVTAVFCMGFLYGSDFSAEIGEAIEADEVALRAEAVTAAGRRGLTEHAATIMALAADERADRELRLSAVEALGDMAPEGAIELLFDVAEEGGEIGGYAEDVAQELTMWQSLEAESDWE